MTKSNNVEPLPFRRWPQFRLDAIADRFEVVIGDETKRERLWRKVASHCDALTIGVDDAAVQNAIATYRNELLTELTRRGVWPPASDRDVKGPRPQQRRGSDDAA
ncbi:MAG: hypothetical protein CTY39_02655 [Hyphomicrobium sp.]|nr:MAG: hypothetical protein CTY39_02655 [Hyphomicrobium sp.]